MASDTSLKRDVENELRWEPSVNEAEIGVAVNKGIVTLTGTVPHFAEKWAAERAVKRVAGVTAVAEELKVKLPGSAQRTDTDIAQAAVQVLEWQVWVPTNIKVKVEAGWVTLEGEVEWRYQRTAAEDAVRYLPGVVGVSNLISVKPKVTAADVETAIQNALARNARLDSDAIRVKAVGGKVTLHGNVRTWAEREEAESVAWSARGVLSVKNDLTIGV